MTPGALYPMQPNPQQMPATLTGQLRLFEADEIGDKYKVSRGGGGIKLAIIGIAAVSFAAALTFFIITATRDTPPTVGRVRVQSVPSGAQVVFDGERLADPTPMTIDSVPVGTRHDIRIEFPHHKAFAETVDIPKAGGDVTVSAVMTPLTGKLRVVTQPDGAEIRIDGQVKGYAPKTIEGLDISSTKKLELRLQKYEPVIIDLTWPDNAEININKKLVLSP